MKEIKKKLIELLDLSISRIFKIEDEDEDEYEIEISDQDLIKGIENGIEYRIEIQIDFVWEEPLEYDASQTTEINDGWTWEFFRFYGDSEIFDALNELGYKDDFWKNWLVQYWGNPDYIEIWDGETLYDEYYFDDSEEAKQYSSIWQIKGELDLLF